MGGREKASIGYLVKMLCQVRSNRQVLRIVDNYWLYLYNLNKYARLPTLNAFDAEK